MPEGNVEVVRLAYDVAYAQRSVEGIREKFAEDFIWHNRPEFPGRSIYTADEMPLLWADLDDTYSEFRLVPVEFIEAGDYVVVTLEMSSRLRGSDAHVEGKIWHVWLVVDGTPSEAWAFGDRRSALEATGLSE